MGELRRNSRVIWIETRQSFFLKKVDAFVDSIYNKNILTIARMNNDYQNGISKYMKKIQLKIAKTIVEQGDCMGISCIGSIYKGGIQDIECPCRKGKFNCDGSDNAVTAAESYIKANQKISKKDMLKRIERLEEKTEKEKSLFNRFTEDFEEGSRFLNGVDGKEYILSRGTYDNKKIWSLVCLESGLTWNGLNTSQDEIFKGTLFTEVIK